MRTLSTVEITTGAFRQVERPDADSYTAGGKRSSPFHPVRKTREMLKEHINDIMIRWSPRQRRGSGYDPGLFLETPEQARRLLRHLEQELARARRDKNRELESELGEILSRVEGLSRKFFRWERDISRNQGAEDLLEIRKLPIRF